MAPRQDKVAKKRPSAKVASKSVPAKKMKKDSGVLAGNSPVKRKRRRRSKKKKEKATATRLPSSGGELSSNWKRLMSEIAPRTSGRYPARKRPLKNRASPEGQKEGKAAPDIWFNDVDELLLDPEDRAALHRKDEEPTNGRKGKTGPESCSSGGDGLVKEKAFSGVTKVVAMDCEMVGVGRGGAESILARVSVVNHFGHCLYDKFVQPSEKVTDYRTRVSGIRPQDIEKGAPFKEVQKEVSDLLQGRLLVGHALKHDLKVLFLDHPRKMTRDTSAYKPFRSAFGGRTPSLKNLTARMVGVSVQEGEHSSVQDAQAAMRLYTMFRKEWEKSLEKPRGERTEQSRSKAGTGLSKAVSASSAVAVGGAGRAVYRDSDDEED